MSTLLQPEDPLHCWEPGSIDDYDSEVMQYFTAENILAKDGDNFAFLPDVDIPEFKRREADVWCETLELMEKNQKTVFDTETPDANQDLPPDGMEQDNSSDFNMEDMCKDMTKEAMAVINAMSRKTRRQFLKRNKDFVKFNKETNGKGILHEPTLCNYIVHLSKTYAPSTLWNIYSMLNRRTKTEHNFNLREMTRLRLILKNLTKGYHATKAGTLSLAQIMKILDALDNVKTDLTHKITILCCFYGMLRESEAEQLEKDWVEIVKMENAEGEMEELVKINYGGRQKNADGKNLPVSCDNLPPPLPHAPIRIFLSTFGLPLFSPAAQTSGSPGGIFHLYVCVCMFVCIRIPFSTFVSVSFSPSARTSTSPRGYLTYHLPN